jgi:hypothetical protein
MFLAMKVNFRKKVCLFQSLFVPTDDRLFNNGSVGSVNIWPYETLDLPAIPSGSKLKFQALYDLAFGGYGLDNVQIYTQQKLVIAT